MFDTYRNRAMLFFNRFRSSIMVYLAVFGPATITAMADNDAAGVATYSIAGAKLGYPILFILVWVTILLAITQEMGMRLSLITRKGLGDLIRENYGIKVSVVMFFCLFFANLGTIIVDVAAFKTTANLLHLPAVPLTVLMIVFVFFFVTKGNFKVTQNIMLLSSFFYLLYIFSAVKSNPDWGLAIKNLAFPQGVTFSPAYWKDYAIIGLGVIGTTITPWGQFFISSFGLDKRIEKGKLRFAQIETYWGAFLTDFFSFFMIVATAATLFVSRTALVSGEQAALAIEPFAGKLASTFFAFGIMNAGFMGIVTVGLTTAYAFSEFFGYSGGLDTKFTQSKTFYYLFLAQIIIAFLVNLLPFINLFQVAILGQTINAIMLPPVFFYLIKLTNNPKIMGEHQNTPFQRLFAIGGTIFILIASTFSMIANFIKF